MTEELKEIGSDVGHRRLGRLMRQNGISDALTDLFIMRGSPAFIRSDNGSEFIAQAVRQWIAAVGAKRLISNQAALGRTDTVRASTAGSEMNCSTERSSTAYEKHR